MGRAERDKGAEAEREVSAIFQANNFDTFRTQNIGGKQTRGDLFGVPGHYLEIRRRERVRVPEWMDEVMQECPADLAPLLICRRSRSPWLAVTPLPDWIDLLKEAKA